MKKPALLLLLLSLPLFAASIAFAEKLTATQLIALANAKDPGLKTAISVYSHGRRQSVDHATQDEEMFI